MQGDDENDESAKKLNSTNAETVNNSNRDTKNQQEKENHLSTIRQKWLSQRVKSYGVALKCLVS